MLPSSRFYFIPGGGQNETFYKVREDKHVKIAMQVLKSKYKKFIQGNLKNLIAPENSSVTFLKLTIPNLIYLGHS